MTCPDWPLCRHTFVPSLANGTIWEWTHRLLAFFILPMVIAVFIAAWRARSRSPLVLPTGSLVVMLFLAQVGLGAATVRLANEPISVVLHWGTAMAFIASLTVLAIFAENEHGPERRSTALSESTLLGLLCGTTLLAFVTMCVGAYVSSSGAGLACLSIPGCAGNVVVYTTGQFVQMLHRFAAAGTLLCASGAFALTWVRKTSSRVRSAASLGLFLVFVQVLLGLLNVVLRLPSNLRELHAINAALVFLAFVTATTFAFSDVRFGQAARVEPSK